MTARYDLLSDVADGRASSPSTVIIAAPRYPSTMTEHKTGPSHAGMYKTLSLVTLTLQNVVAVMVIRYSKTLPGDMYISSTVVVFMELFKFLASLLMLFIQHGSVRSWCKELNEEIFRKPLETLKVAVPAFIYTFQNNLLFVAMGNLDAATFQVVSQIKILTTALFSVVMLRRQLGAMQWSALFILFVGIAVVQLDEQRPQVNNKNPFRVQSPMLGMFAILISSMMSGFAGVYFEKILKASEVSLWLRNVQLSMYAVPMGLLTCFIADADSIRSKGFLYAYSPLIWAVVFLQGFGGLVVAMVVKYADNILKGFATSFAIIFSAIASVYVFNFEIHGMFIIGATLVIVSIFMYGYVPRAATVAARKSVENLQNERIITKMESQVPLLTPEIIKD